MVPIIRIEQRLDYYYYTFTSEDGCLLFFSRLYTSVRECRRGIDVLREHIMQQRYCQKERIGNDYSFSIRDRKQEILGHSIVFFASSPRDYALRKIINQAAGARVVDGVHASSPQQLPV